MKIVTAFHSLVVLAALSFLMTGCRADEALESVGLTTMTAGIEEVTKASVNDAGVVVWNAGDAVSVFNGIGFDTLTLVGTGGSATGVFQGSTSGPAQSVALYPASAEHSCDGSSVSFHLPSSYTYAENGNARMPMMALVSGTGTIKFRHLGGVMKVTYGGIPPTADRFIFRTVNRRVTGNFTVPISKSAILEAESDSSGDSVTVTFSPSSVVTTRTFYIPLPTGEYGNFYVTMYAGNTLIDQHHACSEANVIEKRTLLIMPDINVSGAGISSGEAFVEEDFSLQWGKRQ